MATDSLYLTASIADEEGVHELFRAERRDGKKVTGTRFCWSRAVAQGAARNDIGNRDLEALSVRANAGNQVAKRAMGLLEDGETLTTAWRREVAQLVA